jgi:hypothetical protein
MQKICLTVCALPLVYSVFFYIAIIFRFHFPPWLDTTVIVNTHSSSFWLLINLIIFLWRGCLVSSPVCCCFSLSPVQMSLNNVNKNNSNNNNIKVLSCWSVSIIPPIFLWIIHLPLWKDVRRKTNSNRVKGLELPIRQNKKRDDLFKVAPSSKWAKLCHATKHFYIFLKIRLYT